MYNTMNIFNVFLLADTYHCSKGMWGPWQPWSGCSVTCGEGVRERVRECLLPSSGGMQCTGMVREQSHCSLEDCTGKHFTVLIYLMFCFQNKLFQKKTPSCFSLCRGASTSTPHPSASCELTPNWESSGSGGDLPVPGCDPGHHLYHSVAKTLPCSKV